MLAFTKVLLCLLLVELCLAAPLLRTYTLKTLPLHRMHGHATDVGQHLFRKQFDHAHTRLRRHLKRHSVLTTVLPNTTSACASSTASGRPQGDDSILEAGSTARTNEGISSSEMEALIRNPITPANEPTSNSSMGLGIFSNDVGYVATVQIGNPPRDFTLLVDSGSADTWVPLDTCLTEDGKHPCGNHTFIGKNSSLSLKSTDERWSIVYGSGSTEGILVTDDLVLAGQTITGHKFGAATVESKEFADAVVKYDGVMGTARSTSSSQRTETPVEALARMGFIEQAITSYKLGRVADDANDGEVTFGGMDTSKFNQTTMITAPSVSDAFWAATLEVVSVQGAHLLQVQNRTAILDTGTTLLLVPPEDAAQIHSRIDGAQLNGDGTGYVLPCTTDASVALRFGGHDFRIDPRDLAFAPLDARNLTGMCTSGIASRDLFGDGTWLVGDTFLKSVYFSHNADTNEVSLAELL